MSLQEELSKPEYQPLTNAERLELVRSKSVATVGKIAYGNTLHLVSMLARGLRRRMEECQIQQLKDAWIEALQPAYLASPSYSINVSLPEIRAMLDAGLAAGVCTQAEHDFIVQLATYQRQLWPDVTMRDVVEHFNAELIDGEWHELPATDARSLVVRMQSAPPEQTHIVVQMRDQYGVGESDWYHATALHGLSAAREYSASLPHNGYARKLRWRCEYALDGAVAVV